MKNFKPILFSTEMVKAILEGRKTQTRRIIKPQPAIMTDNCHFNHNGNYYLTREQLIEKAKILKGDVLWVRETWFPTRYDYMYLLNSGIDHVVKYKADGNYDPKKDYVGRSWKPSIHMPKAACRIFLEVTNVRVERLQDIIGTDAVAEGIEVIENEKYGRVFRHYFMGDQEHYFKVPELSFKTLWQSINGHDSWDANPWVWVYDFKKIEKPSNFI